MVHGADTIQTSEGRSALDDDLREIFRNRLEVELHTLTSGRGPEEPDLEAALDHQAQDTIDAVQGALARLDDGTYGQCVECGDHLPIARLMALPHASRCLACQAAAERRR